MKVNKKNKFLTLILLLWILFIVVLGCFYMKQKFNTVNNLSEIKTELNLKQNDVEYVCFNQKNGETKLIFVILFFSSIVICLSSEIIYLLNIIKNKDKKMIIPSYSRSEKNNEIILKYLNDENEIKTQQILNDVFKRKVYMMFCELQTACMNKDYNVLQNILTKELYNQYCISLAKLKLKSRKNIVSDFECISVKFLDTYEDDEKFLIKVKLKTKYYGYVINTNTKEVEKGIKNEKITNVHILSLVKYKKDCSKWLIAEKQNIGNFEQ